MVSRFFLRRETKARGSVTVAKHQQKLVEVSNFWHCSTGASVIKDRCTRNSSLFFSLTPRGSGFFFFFSSRSVPLFALPGMPFGPVSRRVFLFASRSRHKRRRWSSFVSDDGAPGMTVIFPSHLASAARRCRACRLLFRFRIASVLPLQHHNHHHQQQQQQQQQHQQQDTIPASRIVLPAGLNSVPPLFFLFLHCVWS